MSEQIAGAIVTLSAPQGGDNMWEAKQNDNIAGGLPPRDRLGRESIDWSFGPVKVTGYIDTSSFEVGLSITIAGINVGNIYGNLQNGVGLKINLLVATGEIRFYLKNGNEVWVHLDVKIVFDGQYDGDYKIITI